MDDKPTDLPPGEESAFSREVAAKAGRKLRVLRGGQRGVWFGLGMSGLIGWSVAVPTFLGAILGLWWDRRHPGGHSWTLMLLSVGLIIGCINAWHWMVMEDNAMHDESKDKDA
jgi:ATP synthase protein I